MEESAEVVEQSPTPTNRSHPTPRPTPPRPPVPYASTDKENVSISNGGSKVAKKLSIAKEKPVAPTVNSAEGGNIQLARAGETVLETFYGMLYICEDDTKEWKLAANGFIPLCFIQERGNANNPFKVIAAHGSIRVMEFPVTKDTKCTQNKAFVRWHDLPLKMYGVRFAKESQANQFYSAMFRMKSTLLKTAELFKQPERKAMVTQISDPTVEGVSHTKISLIVKLPNKETTIMSVPGLISIGELLDLICKKENLTRDDHVLTLPKVGGKELKYGSDTVLGSLKIREVFITHVDGSSNNSTVEGDVSSKDLQTSGIRTAQAPPRPHNNHVLPELDKKLEKSLAKSDEHLDQQKKETAKVKRRAPRPPQQPPERPKSMPIPRPRTVGSGNEGTPQAKKRQAPARPPAPKVSPRGLDQSKLKTDDKGDRLPPEFCPPPPPDDVPPPLDECELPVSPLSADDETAWINSSGDHDSSQNTSSYVSSFKENESTLVVPSEPPLSPGVSQELASPEPIPLKFLLPSEADAESDDVVEREGRSSRINFIGDSRSSSVDFSCDQDIPTSPILEGYRPPIDLQEIEDIKPSKSEKPHNISPPPPPSDFSNEIQDEISSFDYPGTVPFSGTNAELISVQPPPDFDENVKIENRDIESMVVPPPPTMFDDSPEEQDIISTESNIVLESEESFSIPPPLDFAEDKNFHEEAEEIGESRDKFGDYDESTVKKKLGLSTDMFPWLSEPQPAFQAEISNTRVVSDVSSTENNSSSEQQYLVPSEVETNTETTQENDKQELVPQIDSVVESHVNDVEHQILPTEIIEKETTNNDLHESAAAMESLEDNNEYSGAKYLVSGDEPSVTFPQPKDRVSPTAEDTEYRKSVSSEEGSNSYKTPFDDLGSIEYSGSSLASESDEDFLDLKNLNNLSGNDQTRQGSSDTKIESSNESETLHQEEMEMPHADVTSKLYSFSVVKESSFPSSDSARSEKSISEELKVESSTATPIAVPMDILFQSLEQSSNNTETTSLHGIDNKWQQSKTGPKRPLSSGFKKQSWSDIKNQEKLIQEEKQRKSSLTKTNEKIGTSLSTQHGTIRSTELKQSSLDDEAKSTDSSKVPYVSKDSENVPFKATAPVELRPSHLKNENEVTVSEPVSFPNCWAEIKNQEMLMEQERQRKIEIEKNASPREEEKVLYDTVTTETTPPSSTAPNKSKQETRKPHSYVSSAIERRSSSDTSYNVPGRNFAVPAVKRNDMTHFGSSKTTTISGITYTTKEPASNDSNISATVERVKEQELSTISKTNDHQSSSQGVQGVVMRKKAAKQEDTMQKRKSVQDMMKMFSTEDDPERERRDSTEINPRQSPALRLFEEKMGYRERSSSDISSTASETMPKHSGATRETNVIQVENSKPKSEATIANVADNETKLDTVVPKETTKTNLKETDSSSVRLRTNSFNPKPYGVLFPKEQKSSTKAIQSNKSVVESKKETDLSLRKSSPSPNSYDILFPKKRSTSDTSIETQKPSKSNVTSKTQTESKSDTLVASATEYIKKDSADSKPPRNTENIEQSKTKKNETEKKKQFEKVIPETSKVKSTVDQHQPKNNEDRKLVQASSNERKAADNKQVENASKPVELRKKESAADPVKRYSMPVNLVESSSSSTASRGKNLKILLAPQISDVDVVPKGRVAAMMAAWKSEDQ